VLAPFRMLNTLSEDARRKFGESLGDTNLKNMVWDPASFADREAKSSDHPRQVSCLRRASNLYPATAQPSAGFELVCRPFAHSDKQKNQQGRLTP